jgi:hypothetical protein
MWTVVEVQLDPDKVHWREGKHPDYIKLEGLVPVADGVLEKRTLWTSENRIKVLQPSPL